MGKGSEHLASRYVPSLLGSLNLLKQGFDTGSGYFESETERIELIMSILFMFFILFYFTCSLSSTPFLV